MSRMNQHLEQAKAVGDVVSVSTVVGTLLGLLPYIAAGLSAVWYILRIYEWVEKRRENQSTRD